MNLLSDIVADIVARKVEETLKAPLPHLSPACYPAPIENFVPTGKESSIGDPEWGMYVTPDDPLRATPEKARVYYERLFATYPELRGYPVANVKAASEADIAAAARLFRA